MLRSSAATTRRVVIRYPAGLQPDLVTGLQTVERDPVDVVRRNAHVVRLARPGRVGVVAGTGVERRRVGALTDRREVGELGHPEGEVDAVERVGLDAIGTRHHRRRLGRHLLLEDGVAVLLVVVAERQVAEEQDEEDETSPDRHPAQQVITPMSVSMTPDSL